MAQVAVASNIQAVGAFAAGKHSSAVLVVDGKPPRVFLVGQEIVPGTTLNSIQADVIVLDSPGGPQEVRLPPRPMVAVSGAAPAPNFTRSGNTLTAPSSGTAPAPAPRPSVRSSSASAARRAGDCAWTSPGRTDSGLIAAANSVVRLPGKS